MAELVVMDVGHGNSAAIHEHNHTVIVDAGPRSPLLEYLLRRKVKELALVILSHADEDHIAGLTSVLMNGFVVDRIVVNTDSSKESKTWRELIEVLDKLNRDGTTKLSVGLDTGPIHIEGFDEVSLEAISPGPLLKAFGVGGRDRHGRLMTSNSISSCIRVACRGKPIALLTGDMDQIALDEALHAGANLRAHVLVFPHHGGLPQAANPQSFAESLMNTVQPSTVLFSIGRAKYDNPQPEIVEGVRRASNSCRIACTQLSRQCSKTAPTGRSVDSTVYFSAGSESSRCCAGTIVMDLGGKDLDYTAMEAHTQYITDEVPTPLCRAVPK